MSTDALFSKLEYPSLVGAASSESFDRESVRGYAAGYAAGARAAAADAELRAADAKSQVEEIAAEARASVLTALRALEAAAARTNAMRLPVIADADASLAAAALELAEAILGSELRDGEFSARAAIARALTVAANDEVLVVRMHPDDIAILGDAPASIASARLVGDQELERGDALVETPVGTIDARLQTAVDRARAILLGGVA